MLLIYGARRYWRSLVYPRNWTKWTEEADDLSEDALATKVSSQSAVASVLLEL